MKIFDSQDSRYMIKAALLITGVPALMLGVIVYSLWLLLAINHSYFKSAGLVIIEPSQETFLFYILKSQIDYLPYLGLFFIGVFFLGLLMAYFVLRPFNEIQVMCQEILEGKVHQDKLEGLNSQKMIIRLGHFLCDFVIAKKSGKSIPVPEVLEKVKGPTMDWVFYFQFLCMMIILTVITVTSINFFTTILFENVTQVALEFFKKPPKGMDTFILSQAEVINLIILVPSLISCILYAFIARVLIHKVEGVTFAYIRDVRDVAHGQIVRRIRPRADDPGKNAAESINLVLDSLYPQPKKQEIEETDSLPYPSPI